MSFNGDTLAVSYTIPFATRCNEKQGYSSSRIVVCLRLIVGLESLQGETREPGHILKVMTAGYVLWRTLSFHRFGVPKNIVYADIDC